MTKTHFFAPVCAARSPRLGGYSEDSSDTRQSRAKGRAGAIQIASGSGGAETRGSADGVTFASSVSQPKRRTHRRRTVSPR